MLNSTFMFNTTFDPQYTFVILFINIIASVLFTSVTVFIAMNYAKRKACMENITLITGKNYITVVLIFSVINCIASFASFMSMYATYYFTYIPVCSIFTVLSALVEYFIARTVVFKKFSFDKKEKNKNESRIRFLERMIKTAEIIPDDAAEDEIGMNSIVTVQFEEDGSEETYTIVTTMRGNSLENLISVESPIGKALMGHKAGDRVEVEVSKDYSYGLLVQKIEKDENMEEHKLRDF